MLNTIITITGIIFIAFLLKYYKEYKLKDKLPLFFIIPIMFIVTIFITTLLYKLRLISSVKHSHLFLIFFLIIAPMLYFISLKYFVKTKCFISFRNQTQLYIKNLKPQDKFIKNTLLEFALFVTSLTVIFLFLLFLRNTFRFLTDNLASISQVAQLNQTMASQQAMMLLYQNVELLKPAITRSVIALIIVFSFLLLKVSSFKSLIWSNVLKQKYDRLFFKRFAISSIIWYIVWIAIIAFCILIFEPKVGAVMVVLLYLFSLYLRLIINLNFNKKRTVVQNLNNFRKGFKRNHLLIPFIFISQTFMLLLIIVTVLVSFRNAVYLSIMSVLTLIFLTLFINWARYYLANVYKTSKI